jgi:hypothetical protein
VLAPSTEGALTARIKTSNLVDAAPRECLTR